jgi:hypothetical protein
VIELPTYKVKLTIIWNVNGLPELIFNTFRWYSLGYMGAVVSHWMGQQFCRSKFADWFGETLRLRQKRGYAHRHWRIFYGYRRQNPLA